MDNEALLLDLLEWLDTEPRTYDEVMTAWRSTCPRLTIWEDAQDAGLVHLEHGEPLIFGKNKDRGIRMANPYRPEVDQLGGEITEKDLLVHDEQGPVAYAAMLAELKLPEFPIPVGVIRRVQAPAFEVGIRDQVKQVTEQKGAGDLQQALYSGTQRNATLR